MSKKSVMLFVLFLMVVMSGCKTLAKDEMLKYMEDKYDEKFEFVTADTQVWSSKNAEMKLRSEKYPNYLITVSRNDKTGAITDNYISLLMKQRIENMLSALLEKVYEEYKVYYIPKGFTLPSTASPTMSIVEYSQLNDLPLSIQIAVGNSIDSKERSIEKLRTLLEEKQIKCQLYIFYMKDGMLDKLTDTNREELFRGATREEWAIARGDFMMDDNFQFKTSSWREF